MPAGPVNVESVTRHGAARQAAVYRSIEGLIQHFELLMPNRGYEVPNEEIYAATGIAQRRTGLLHGRRRHDPCLPARTRPPSYIHFGLFPHMIRGYQLSDVVAVLGSINIIAAELDR